MRDSCRSRKDRHLSGADGEGGKKKTKSDKRNRFAYVILQELTWCEQEMQNKKAMHGEL